MGSMVISRAAASVVATVVAAGLLSAQPASASSGEELSASEAAQVVAEAVAVEGVPAATDAAEVTQSGEGVVSDVPNSPLSLVLPDAEVTGQTASATVVDGAGDSQAVVQDVGAQGQRVAFIINTPTDPTEYRVDFDGASELLIDPLGGVAVIDLAGQPLATVDAPWARDANGVDVPTRFVVQGTALVQVVDHSAGNYAYPITADPLVRYWWGWQLVMSNLQAERLAGAIFAGAGVTGLLSAMAMAGIISSPGAVPTGVATAILTLGGSWVSLCNWNKRGVTYNVTRTGQIWCWPR